MDCGHFQASQTLEPKWVKKHMAILAPRDLLGQISISLVFFGDPSSAPVPRHESMVWYPRNPGNWWDFPWDSLEESDLILYQYDLDGTGYLVKSIHATIGKRDASQRQFVGIPSTIWGFKLGVFTKSMPKSTAWWVWHIDIWQNHSVADILIPWCPTRWKKHVRIHFDTVLKTRHCICIFMGIWCVYVVWYANIHKYYIHTRIHTHKSGVFHLLLPTKKQVWWYTYNYSIFRHTLGKIRDLTSKT
jgi:hypothetical protein